MTTIALSSPADDANIIREERSDGSVWLRSTKPLAPFSHRVTERVEYWAQFTPDQPFLAQRAPEGWRTITYRSTLNAVRSIGQALLDRGLEKANPVLAPSGNGHRACAAVFGVHACRDRVLPGVDGLFDDGV
jgi:feruloyl-CoA synthase